MRRWIAPLLGLAILTSSCGPEVAARVGNEVVATSGLQREVDTMRANAAYADYLTRATGSDALRDEQLLPSVVLDVLTTQITTLLLEEEIARRDIQITADDRKAGAIDASAGTGRPTIIAAFPAWYRTTLEQRATHRVALRRTLISRETPEDYYADHRDEFLRVCTRHIVVRTRAGAERARERIVGGEPFAEVAQDVSLDEGSAPKGGNLGCNGRADLRPELNTVALTQGHGVVSDPIRTEDGYQILLVEDRYLPPIEQVRGEVAGAIGRLGEERLVRLLSEAARREGVDVSPDIGRWNGERVVPR